ncbi:LysE family translocator [Celeribacter indicus]|uniref:Amino acid transporter LysE n=1 Tax=Celeribacter indicus TaxID=1208324 RepID=A0A0B5DNH6_9RHOB|nr:LysE family translocator [Celeribacter indicus]AJE44719.1 amino acid transporter LysE [Celeribacter indicus]SDX55181.1 Threonine/homoserine/homoserine lactone efflux protein [Celeribacter indicus]
MTITAVDLGLYAFALLILFITPGPVWLAMLARALSGGFNAAWPLALGVVIGDVLWSLLAILGVSWIVSEFTGFLTFLRWVAVAMFLAMGILLIRHADKKIAADSRLTRPGMWAGFVAGLVAILGNPKAILFYMGFLPGFFDLSTLGVPDILAICTVSALIPLLGNLILGASVGGLRRIMSSPQALRRMNVSAGSLLILVALIIPFT